MHLFTMCLSVNQFPNLVLSDPQIKNVDSPWVDSLNHLYGIVIQLFYWCDSGEKLLAVTVVPHADFSSTQQEVHMNNCKYWFVLRLTSVSLFSRH